MCQNVCKSVSSVYEKPGSTREWMWLYIEHVIEYFYTIQQWFTFCFTALLWVQPVANNVIFSQCNFNFTKKLSSMMFFYSVTTRCHKDLNFFLRQDRKITRLCYRTAGCVPCCELTSPRALVVKEDPVDREHVVGLSKVHHDPVGIELRGTWGERRRKTETEGTGWQEHISTRNVKRHHFTQNPTVSAIVPLWTTAVHKQTFSTLIGCFYSLNQQIKLSCSY